MGLQINSTFDIHELVKKYELELLQCKGRCNIIAKHLRALRKVIENDVAPVPTATGTLAINLIE